MKRLVLCLVVCAAAPAEEAPLKLAKTIALHGVHGRIDHMALDPKGEHLYVAALGNGTVENLDLVAGKKLDPVETTKEPQGVFVLPKSGFVVVASGGDNMVVVVRPADVMSHVVAELEDADNVRFEAATENIYVGGGDGELAVIDAKKEKKIASIALDAHPESFQLEAKGDRIFVNVPAKKEVEVVDRKKQAVIAKWKLEGAESNFPMALDEAGGRLYVGCRRPAKILVLDTATGKQVAALDAPGDADDIFWDASSKRLFVSGGDGTVAVYRKGEGDTYETAPVTKTASGARTSLLSPDGKKLFVAAPEKEGRSAEIQVWDVQPAK